METMTPADSPTRYNSNDHFIHEANLTLYIKNVESVNTVSTFIACVRTHALVSSRTKSPTAVFRGGAFPGNEHDANLLTLVTDDQRFPQFVNGFWCEGVTHFRAIERNTRYAVELFKRNFLIRFDGLPF